VGQHWDESGWPVVRLHIEGGQSADDLEDYLEHLQALLRRGRRFAVVTTTASYSRTDPGGAKRQLAWMAEHGDELAERLAGMASVVEPAELEGSRRSLTSLSRVLSFPCAAFADEGEALRWAQGQVTAAPVST